MNGFYRGFGMRGRESAIADLSRCATKMGHPNSNLGHPARARTTSRAALSRSRNAPLKPTQGLSGCPPWVKSRQMLSKRLRGRRSNINDNMKIRVSFRLFINTLGCFIALYCGATSLSQQIDDNLLNSTVLIRRQLDGGESRGTGFLVFHEIAKNTATGRSTYQIVLVTNKHMLPAEHSKFPQITIKIAVRNGATTDTKDLPIDILGKDGKFLRSVATNPKPQVDVAVNIGPQITKEKAEFLIRASETGKALSTDLLLPIKNFKEADIGIGTQIYLLGYPAGFSDPRNISPILRVGIISTEPDKDYSFDEKTSKAFNLPSPIPGFLIDANVYPGSSGSMIVRRTNIVTGFNPGGKASVPYVLGIVADSIPMHDTGINANERMGLGIVFNSDTILETIKLLPVDL